MEINEILQGNEWVPEGFHRFLEGNYKFRGDFFAFLEEIVNSLRI